MQLKAALTLSRKRGRRNLQCGGVLTVSKSADLAVLKADRQPQKLLRFLDLTKPASSRQVQSVAVVGSSAGWKAKGKRARNDRHCAIVRSVGIAGATAAEFGWVASRK